MNKTGVYIVGGDHHNGLGLARIFGINGVVVHSIVIGDCKKSFLSKSKYVFDSKIFCTEQLAYDYLSEIKKSHEKAFIIPYSDAAAFELDRRLDEFKDDYFVPSINNRQGEIVKLMNKQNQYDFAKSFGIRMAKTLTIDFTSNKMLESENIPFPCIIKPVLSAEGHKRDITICKNYDELRNAFKRLRKTGYLRVLVQEYLNVEYEIDVFGCILKQDPYICQIPTKTLRSWLPQGGTNCFSRIITNKKILFECNNIINAIKEYGFYGLYDIELFVVDGNIVLNEINLRNSGDVYMGLSQNYYYPYAWYCDMLKEKVDILASPKCPDYTMTECADIRNVLSKRVKFKNWIRDYHKCNDFALKFKGDMKPAISRYFYYFIQFLRGKRL